VRVIPDASQMARVKQGDVLVTDMNDPNWEPVMKLAAAIVTNGAAAPATRRSSRASSAFRCSRLRRCTRLLRDGQQVTVSCAG